MRKDQEEPRNELDISWRTRELGPEMRRALFRKAVPWVKLASPEEGVQHEHPAGDQARRERDPHGRRGGPDSGSHPGQSSHCAPEGNPDHSS